MKKKNQRDNRDHEPKDKRLHLETLLILKEQYIMLKSLFLQKNNIEKKLKNALIINNGFLGDTIHSLPALVQFIKKSGLKTDIIVGPVSKPLIERLKGVNKVYSMSVMTPRALDQTRKAYIKKDYDTVIILRVSDEAYEALKKIRYSKIVNPLPYLLKFGLSGFLDFKKKNIWRWSELNLEIVGEKKKMKRFNFDSMFEFKKSDYIRINKLDFLRNNKKKIIIHTGSAWSRGLWKDDYWIGLIEKIKQKYDADIIFIGANDSEEKSFQYIESKLNFKIYSVIKKLDTRDIYLLMKKSHFFFGIDSGPRHIADIANIPGICLIGPGPKFWNPMNKKIEIIDKSNCICIKTYCYRKESCINKITVNEVFQIFERMQHKNN